MERRPISTAEGLTVPKDVPSASDVEIRRTVQVVWIVQEDSVEGSASPIVVWVIHVHRTMSASQEIASPTPAQNPHAMMGN